MVIIAKILYHVHVQLYHIIHIVQYKHRLCDEYHCLDQTT
jgi:hypothetical protein